MLSPAGHKDPGKNDVTPPKQQQQQKSTSPPNAPFSPNTTQHAGSFKSHSPTPGSGSTPAWTTSDPVVHLGSPHSILPQLSVKGQAASNVGGGVGEQSPGAGMVPAGVPSMTEMETRSGNRIRRMQDPTGLSDSFTVRDEKKTPEND